MASGSESRVGDEVDEIEMDGQLNQIRNVINQNKLKLWLPPYYEDDGPNFDKLLEATQMLSPALDLSEDTVLEGLRCLQQRALDKLSAKEVLKEAGTIRLKVKLAKNIKCLTGKTLDTLEVKGNTTGEELASVIAGQLDSDLDAEDLRVISAGKVIQPQIEILEQGIRPGGAIMVVRINSKDSSLQILQEQKQYLNSSKEDARLLAEENDEGSSAFTVTDQSGKSLDLAEDERKALIISMSLHEKGKAAAKKKNFDLALVLLLEADVEYQKVRSQILEAADNYGLLNLDICWCYVQLGQISQLEDAVHRLNLCQMAFQKSYGKNMERVEHIKGTSIPEKAVLLKMNLLQAIAYYHNGDPRSARDKMRKVHSAYKTLALPEDSIKEVVAQGYTESEARIALRVTGGRIAEATAYAQNKREMKEIVEEEEEERRKKRSRYGRTINDNKVNLGYMSTLQKMGFSEDYACAALRQTDNDINAAVDLIQTSPDILDVAIACMISDRENDKERKRNDSEMELDNPERKRHRESRKRARMEALKRYEKEVGVASEDWTEDHLNLTLQDEFEIIQKYDKILKIDSDE